MTRQEIKNKLVLNHSIFADLIVSLNENDFLFSANGKWTAGQQLDHIVRSVGALKQGMLLPKFALKLIIGKANRPSKDYESLVAKYKTRLEAGGKAVGRFVPKPVSPANKEKLRTRLLNDVNRLCKSIDHYDEGQLDFYILPHPLLGKLTIREMMYFTIYHVKHHQDITMRNLSEGKMENQKSKIEN
jgi:hypothetical protein